MTITKNSLIMMIFFLTIKHCLAQSANSQQPTANSQQPTANSQQPNFNQNNILFYVNKFTNKKSSLGIRSVFSLHSVAALFLCLFGSSTGLRSMFSCENISFVHVVNSSLLTDRTRKNLPVWGS